MFEWDPVSFSVHMSIFKSIGFLFLLFSTFLEHFEIWFLEFQNLVFGITSINCYPFGSSADPIFKRRRASDLRGFVKQQK